MDNYEMQDRIREILQGKIAMGGDDDNIYQVGGYRQRRKAIGGRLRRQPSSKLGDAVGAINYFDFVKDWQMANPGYTWKEAVELASPAYHEFVGGYGTSAGAKKGWITRRMHEDEGLIGLGVMVGGSGTSAGAKKGWITRRRNMRKRIIGKKRGIGARKDPRRVAAGKRGAKKNPFIKCQRTLRQLGLREPFTAISRDNYCKLNKKCYFDPADKNKYCKKK